MSPLTPEGPDHMVISFEPQVRMVQSINERRIPRLYMVCGTAQNVGGRTLKLTDALWVGHSDPCRMHSVRRCGAIRYDL
jgi:hypothetical protein